MAGKILIGIDTSAPSRAAVTWAVARAHSVGSRVELVHVIADAGADHAEAQELLDDELARARALEPDVRVAGRLLVGQPATALARHSRGFDLLVVGTHKTGFIFGRTFGSAFVTLAWTARCPVAFIPDLVGTSRRGIVAARDGAASADNAIDLAAGEAARSGDELILVGAARLEAAGREPLSDDLLNRATADHAVRVRFRESDRGSAEALVDASGRAALLVVGRGRSVGAGAFRSLVHDILLNLGSPVIIVPAQVD